jgi:hypothetical protein
MPRPMTRRYLGLTLLAFGLAVALAIYCLR